jgi:hypothetical protein
LLNRTESENACACCFSHFARKSILQTSHGSHSDGRSRRRHPPRFTTGHTSAGLVRTCPVQDLSGAFPLAASPRILSLSPPFDAA